MSGQTTEYLRISIDGMAFKVLQKPPPILTTDKFNTNWALNFSDITISIRISEIHYIEMPGQHISYLRKSAYKHDL